MTSMSAADEFLALVSGPDERIALDTGCLLIAALGRGRPDDASVVTDGRAQLDQLAARSDATDVDGLLRYLFGTLGFTGNRDHYDDPRNSYLDEVLDRRCGIPITLAVVVIEVGRRLGLVAERNLAPLGIVMAPALGRALGQFGATPVPATPAWVSRGGDVAVRVGRFCRATNGNTSSRHVKGFSSATASPETKPPTWMSVRRGQPHRSIASPIARAPSHASPSGYEPWVLTHTHTTGISHAGWASRSVTRITRARHSRPNINGRGDHPGALAAMAMVAAIPERTAVVDRPSSAITTAVAAITTPCTATSTWPPTRSAAPYTNDASQLCTVHACPGAVNE